MQAGKPKDQSLAISYSVQRKAKRKKMAAGGPVSAKTEQRPMPEQMDNDAKQAHKVSAKPIVDGQWDENPVIPRPKTQKLKHPSMAQSPVFKVRLRDQEDDLIDSQAPNEGPQRQPPEMYNEEGPNRQGPDVPALHMKRMAEGGMMPEDHGIEEMEREDEAHLQSMEAPSEDMGESEARSLNEEGPNRRGPRVPALDMKMMAEGGMAQEEIDDQAHDSMAAAIMAKRRKSALMDSDSDIDHEMLMASGGSVESGSHDMDMAEGGEINGMDSIYAHPEKDQADLRRNAEEDANMEDQSSFNALRKENYSESAGLRQMDSPMDSNEHGHDIDSDEHDRVSAIRRRMAAKRQFRK